MASSSSPSSEERRAWLRDQFSTHPLLTVQEAWQLGHDAGIYVGGDATLVKDDLNAVAHRHDGYWRVTDDPDPDLRRRAVRWDDFWKRGR